MVSNSKRKKPRSIEMASLEGSLQSIDMQLCNLLQKLDCIADDMRDYIHNLDELYNINLSDKERFFSCFRKAKPFESLINLLRNPSSNFEKFMLDHELRCRRIQSIVFESLKAKRVLVEKLKRMISEVDLLKKEITLSESKYLNSLSSKCFGIGKSSKRVKRLQERKDGSKLNLKHQLQRIQLQSNIVLNHKLYIQPEVSLFNAAMTWRHIIVTVQIAFDETDEAIVKKTSQRIQSTLKHAIERQKLKNQQIMKQFIEINRSYKLEQHNKSSLNPFSMFRNQKNQRDNELYHVLYSIEDLASPSSADETGTTKGFDYFPLTDKIAPQAQTSFDSQSQGSLSSEEEVSLGAEYKGFMKICEHDDLIDSSYLVRS